MQGLSATAILNANPTPTASVYAAQPLPEASGRGADASNYQFSGLNLSSSAELAATFPP